MLEHLLDGFLLGDSVFLNDLDFGWGEVLIYAEIVGFAFSSMVMFGFVDLDLVLVIFKLKGSPKRTVTL